MDYNYLDHLILKMDSRLKRMKNCNRAYFPIVLTQFYHFLNDNLLFKEILEDIIILENNSKKKAIQIWETGEATIEYKRKSSCLIGSSSKNEYSEREGEHVATTIHLLQMFVDTGISSFNVLRHIVCSFDFSQNPDANSVFDIFLLPLVEYIKEKLLEANIHLGLIKKYKQRSEWFKRDYLQRLLNSDSGKSEKNIANDLYEYMHNQGVEFYIEPVSRSGKTDILARLSGKNKIVMDAKVFRSDTTVTYLKKGFVQLYSYLCDHNESVGYLVIYHYSEKDLNFTFASGAYSFPQITYNGKVIFFAVIDIRETESASKKSKPKTIDITKEDFFNKDSSKVDHYV